MTLKPLHGLVVALALAAAAPSASAAAQRMVRITAATQYVTVEYFETLKIENDKGQSFVWKFDSVGEQSFPLSVIAPKGFAAGQTTVYIRHPAAQVPGG